MGKNAAQMRAVAAAVLAACVVSLIVGLGWSYPTDTSLPGYCFGQNESGHTFEHVQVEVDGAALTTAIRPRFHQIAESRNVLAPPAWKTDDEPAGTARFAVEFAASKQLPWSHFYSEGVSAGRT